jgi:hypothetical protein
VNPWDLGNIVNIQNVQGREQDETLCTPACIPRGVDSSPSTITEFSVGKE